MTEQQRLQFAKLYIESMANGINPVTKQPAAENDMTRDPHIVKCLLYVADTLGAVLEDGMVGKQETSSCGTYRKNKPVFFITEEQKSQLQTFDTPTYVSDVAKELNRVTENNECKKILPQHINNWLMSVGMLEESDDGRNSPSKKATDKGILIGIRSEEALDGKGMTFFRTYYSPRAQLFIYENIESIISYNG